MKKSVKLLLTISTIAFYLLSNVGCKIIGNDCDTWDQEPTEMRYYAFEKEGRIIDNIIDEDYELYCYLDGEKYTITYKINKKVGLTSGVDTSDGDYKHYFFRSFNDIYSIEDSTKNGLYFLRIAYLSRYDIHDFYLENKTTGLIDTLTINAEYLDSPCDALKEACRCHNPIRSFKLNGEDVYADDELTKYYSVGYPVYRLRVK